MSEPTTTAAPDLAPLRVGDVVVVESFRGQRREGVVSVIKPPKNRRQRRIFLTVKVEIDGETLALHYESGEVHRPGEPAVEWEWNRP